MQITEINADLVRQRDQIPHDVNARRITWLNDNINSQIIPRAVQLLIHQYELSNGPDTQCSRSFEQIYGIPCQHTLKNLITRGTIITASHFNHY